MLRRILAITILALLAPAGYAAGTQVEMAVSRPNTVWAFGASTPLFVSSEMGVGYEFACDFSRADPTYPRCYWDTQFGPEDLSTFRSFALKAKVPDPEAVQSVQVYFRSGTGWYMLKGAAGLKAGWNTIVLDREAGVESEGGPAGWQAISGLRINVFPKSGAPVKVTLVGLEASTVRLSSGPPPLFEVPAADRDLPRAQQRDGAGRLLETRMLLDETGAWMIRQDELLERLRQAGFNAFMPCVWHGGGTNFHSTAAVLEPVFAPRFADGQDPFADLIRKAHTAGIEVHPWFQVALRGSPDPRPDFTTSGVPGGTYDLQDPAVRQWLVALIVGCARDYDVDGISLDFIRTMGISYSDIARAAYQERFGVSMDETRGEMSAEVRERLLRFQEEAVTGLVRGVREGLRAVRPGLIVSVCGRALPKPQLQYEGRNEWLWLERDLIDIAYFMAYDWRPDFPAFAKAAEASGRPDRNVPLLANYDNDANGDVVSRSAEQVARLVDYALRKFPANGIAMYWFPSLNDAQIAALRRGPFREDAVPHWTIAR